MQQITPLTALHQLHALESSTGSLRNTAAFQKGFQSGIEASTDDQYAGEWLTNADDVWRFLEGEMSPRVRKNDRLHKQFFTEVYEMPVSELPERVGFLVGYLTAMFAPGTTTPTRHRGLAGQRDTDGFTLDASGWPMDL